MFKDTQEFMTYAINFYTEKCKDFDFLYRQMDPWDIKGYESTNEITDKRIRYASKCNQIIEELYNIAKLYNVKLCDFGQFELFVKNYNIELFVKNYNKRNCWRHSTKKASGFVYTGQERKPPQDKLAWWQHKNLIKTRRKADGWRQKWKKHFKNACKRKHRALEREALGTGKLEKLEKLHYRSYKQAEDIWSWD